MIINATYDAKHVTGLKTLRPKQMLQRLPVTLAQGKENLLNEIFINKKEINKKVLNNINTN